MSRRFVSIGECMVEMAPTAGGDYRLGFAGDTLNTAWYARRCFGSDWEVAYCTAVGQDAISQRMKDFIADAGIRTDLVRSLPDRTVGLYLIQLDKGERSFAYWRSDSAARKLASDRATIDAALSTAEVIFFSGITLAILSPEDRTTLLDAASEARRGGATVAFDPNLRPRLWESAEVMREAIMAAARVSDILLPSFDDDAAAFGELTTDETARRYADAGVRLVVVKNASGEMLALENGKITRYAPTPVAEIVDSTAAGDSFNAAFLARYFETGDVIKALAAGATLAAKVIGQRGALIDIGK